MTERRRMQMGLKPNLLAASIAFVICAGLLVADIQFGFMPFGDPWRAALFGGIGGLVGWSVGYRFFPKKRDRTEDSE
ncbi:hypothetical protein WNY37_14625 [Henriciella sp. AS95]|uniref:hypothetical protein n=1 Tax=Henriciella sp. AS95 TaxID=3135782 RepID=UPI00316D3C57